MQNLKIKERTLNYKVGIQEAEKVLGGVCEDWRSSVVGLFYVQSYFSDSGWMRISNGERKKNDERRA